MKKNNFPMTLQLFAEGDGDGAGGGNVSGAGASGEGTSSEPLSFDGFLAQEGNQAEFDRRVQKAIDTAVSNAQQKWQALTDDKLSEAEKLAKMNK
ncbi:MAG: phage capsid protein, partial [Coprococcus sp.]